MARFTLLSRRAVPRRLGGAVLPLPALEIMAPAKAQASGPLPTRYVVCYGGQSTGGFKVPGDLITPTADGVNYEITRGLKPIGELQMKEHVGIVSGLKIP